MKQIHTQKTINEHTHGTHTSTRIHRQTTKYQQPSPETIVKRKQNPYTCQAVQQSSVDESTESEEGRSHCGWRTD